ncbi:UDP binding domain-containing protein [Ruegeria atlantica]|uniref:UDP-glucose 6-dehydrogenase YwqF n=1 Tax=Ruegeria atlantica TaxID=81569 RepID=A0A0P1E3X6_9RHOB|nr:UDP-glucose 6-dehydrogenase YwqF [Ruegeria atlantica]
MIDKIREACDDHFNNKTVAMLGATFKSNIDDMRDAPSLPIVPALIGGGARVRAADEIQVICAQHAVHLAPNGLQLHACIREIRI